MPKYHDLLDWTAIDSLPMMMFSTRPTDASRITAMCPTGCGMPTAESAGVGCCVDCGVCHGRDAIDRARRAAGRAGG